jgi:hypothetical protein
MASAELSRRMRKVVGYPPLSELGGLQRREFHEALLEAGGFEGRFNAAVQPEGFGWLGFAGLRTMRCGAGENLAICGSYGGLESGNAPLYAVTGTYAQKGYRLGHTGRTL